MLLEGRAILPQFWFQVNLQGFCAGPTEDGIAPVRPTTAGGREYGGLKLEQAKRMKELEKENMPGSPASRISPAEQQFSSIARFSLSRQGLSLNTTPQP